MAAPVLDSSSPFTNSPLPLTPRLPRGPVSPVAPRRTAVAAVVRTADLGLPCAALHLSGFSYERRLPAGRDSSPVCAIESQRAPAIPICAQGFGLLAEPRGGCARARFCKQPKSLRTDGDGWGSLGLDGTNRTTIAPGG